MFTENEGDLDLALEYYFKTLKIENELEDKEGYAYILNNIGNVYSDLRMYDKSLEYHKESLKVKEQLGNKYGIATSIRNIGEIYLNLNKPQRALEYFEKQLDLATEINDINGIAAAKTDIGRAYINLRDYSEAEKYLEESLKIIEKTGDKVGIIHACVSFSSFYIELGEYEKAIKFLDSSLEMAKEEDFLENLRDIYLNYSVIYSNINKPTKALDYYKKYTAIKDSIFNSEISSKITELQIQRTSEELEKEKTLLEEKNTFQQLLLAKKNQLIYALIAITILIFLLIILVYNRFLNKQRIEKKLREANATKDKFFSIIAHDLSNPFNSIMGFANLLHLEYDYHSDEEKRLMIDNLYKVSENTYKLLQNLLEWAKTQTNNLNFIPEVLDLGEITEENITIFRSVANNKNIKVNSELNGEIEVVGDKNMVKTILRNLISNAIKFTPDGGFVNISASKKKKNVEICVKDNGTGIKPEDLKKLFTIDDHLHSKGTANENGSGLGLILCKEFVEINGGKIWAESQYGKESKFIFTLPSN